MDLIELIEKVRENLALTIKKSLDEFIKFDKAVIDNEDEYITTTICEAPEGITWGMLKDTLEDLDNNVEIYCENYGENYGLDTTYDYVLSYKGINFKLSHNTYVGDFQINYEKESEE